MVKIAIFTMVKNEDDIIREWIEYHGNLFGYENLYVVDNYSTDATYDISKEYELKGVHVSRESDYKWKGNYTTWYKDMIDCDIFIPLDIDEFICYYDKETHTVNKDTIVSHLETLFNNSMNDNSNQGVFKMNYLYPIKTTNEPGLQKFTHGCISDYKEMAKTFIIKSKTKNNFYFDHGNHYPTDNYILSSLLLIHYHHRSHDQYLKKIIANVTGLGYGFELEELKKLDSCDGIHRVHNAIHYLENPHESLAPPIGEITSDMIDLKGVTP